MVELTKWVPAQRPALSFYAGGSNPSTTEIQDALIAFRAAQIGFVSDPSRDVWTHHVVWDGAQWIAYAHSRQTPSGQITKDKPIELGAKLSPAALRKLRPASEVWFDVPLARESVQALLAPPPDGAPPSAAVFTSDRTQAMYVVAGTVNDTGISYAWFKRSDIDAEVRTLPGIGAGCSPNSSYPLRTDWDVPSKLVPPELGLSASAVQLARLNGWLQLGSSSLTGQGDYPYRLVLRRVPEGEEIADGGTTHDKGTYDLALVSNTKASVLRDGSMFSLSTARERAR